MTSSPKIGGGWNGPPAVELHQMAALGRLLAGIIHEINSPLASVFSNNDVIRHSLEAVDKLLDDPHPEALANARRMVGTCRNLVEIDSIACERIRSIIRGLKSFSRPDGGEPRRVNLNEQLRDTLKLAQADFRRRIKVETEWGELPEVECYPQMLNQVFLNLLVNAGQAIAGEGTIRVRTRFETDQVHVAVSDTGCGMTPEQQARAFEAGFTTKPLGEGAGWGLSISKEIIEDRHGGSLNFESHPGAGSTFHIRIPVRARVSS